MAETTRQRGCKNKVSSIFENGGIRGGIWRKLRTGVTSCEQKHSRAARRKVEREFPNYKFLVPRRDTSGGEKTTKCVSRATMKIAIFTIDLICVGTRTATLYPPFENKKINTSFCASGTKKERKNRKR